MDLCLCGPLFCCRYCPCVPSRNTDVLFFGDSSIDHFAQDGGNPFSTRATWTRFQQELTEVAETPLVTVNRGCSGAPAYNLCCVSPCLLYCQRPKSSIVFSMGGNEFIWLPCPLVHSWLTRSGYGCPSWYVRCFLQQTAYCNPGVPVVFIPDYSVHHGCPWVGYDRFLNELRSTASTIITPSATDTSDTIIAWSYHVENKEALGHPSLVYIDTLPLHSRLEVEHPELYAEMFTTTLEQTEKAYSMMWAPWLKTILPNLMDGTWVSSPGSNFDYSMEMGDLEQKEGSAERKDW